jgi:hypothetical protein
VTWLTAWRVALSAARSSGIGGDPGQDAERSDLSRQGAWMRTAATLVVAMAALDGVK